jgi:hypothetical protein
MMMNMEADQEDNGNSTGYEELEAEWINCGGYISTGSTISTVMFVGDPGSKESIFAFCICCNESGHLVIQCMEFLEMSVVQRHGVVRKMGACRKCLKGKHFARECPETTKCQMCDSPTHNTLLHFDTRQLMGREMGQSVRGLGRNGNYGGRNMNRTQGHTPSRTT